MFWFCFPSKLDLILTKLEKIMATIDELVADVAAQSTVIDGLDVLLKNLADQIAALKSNQTDPATAAKIDALAASVTENTKRIQDDVTTNTNSA
jgi:hypothetical protein